MPKEGSVAVLILVLILVFFVVKKAFRICFALWHKWNIENVADDTLAAWERYDKSLLKQKDVWGHEMQDRTPSYRDWQRNDYLKQMSKFEKAGSFEQREQEERQLQSEEKGSTNSFYQTKEWRKLRYQAFKKYGNNCAVCGRSPKDGLIMHVDHIKPRSRYPHLALEITNLQIMCKECNVSKSNKDNIKWR
ncbi:hypothetical protein B1H58_04785 [Pantoea alhagi]|uniref:HNH nuclease domain-containing protein n=1 Tax=Pantoea alhagi TaxID=1891675 RepID=A0A1W6B2U6_9GAMM|nr:HNH endonuclease signature motif containing protein [Pantoea alhagi]ARJ41389.1 hypothetical protein B1H58_04785 [Pantoea alhagi]